MKLRRTAPHIKMRPSADHPFWAAFTAPLLEFIVSNPRTWGEIDAWGRARQYVDTTIVNMVAYLDNSGKITNVFHDQAQPALWAQKVDEEEAAS